jgi:hypothetical protein
LGFNGAHPIRHHTHDQAIDHEDEHEYERHSQSPPLARTQSVQFQECHN